MTATLALGSFETAYAKTPGKTFCFLGTCHRVKTLPEMQQMVGQVVTLHASHYDDPKRDRYNPSNITSSGEFFRWDRPDNAASPIYPDGTVVLLWNPVTRQSAVVRINNAGPYWGKRNLDVSKTTAEKLGFARQGVATLRAKILSAPSWAEATYRRGRNYTPVRGYIGQHASLESAALFIGGRIQPVPAVPSLNYADATRAAAGREGPQPERLGVPSLIGVDPTGAAASLVVADAAGLEGTPVPIPLGLAAVVAAADAAAPEPTVAAATARVAKLRVARAKRPAKPRGVTVAARAKPAWKQRAAQRLASSRVSPTRMAASVRDERPRPLTRDRYEQIAEARRPRVANAESAQNSGSLTAVAGLRCRPGFTLRVRGGEGRQRAVCVSSGEPVSRPSDRPVRLASVRNRS